MTPNQENFEKLEAYIDGEIDAVGRAEVEKQLAANPQLRKMMAELQSMRTVLSSLPRATAPADMMEDFQSQIERSSLLDDSSAAESPTLRISRWPQFMSIAAIVLLAVGLAAVIYKILPDQTSHLKVASNTAPPGVSTDAGSLDGISTDTTAPTPNTLSRSKESDESSGKIMPADKLASDTARKRTDAKSALSPESFATKGATLRDGEAVVNDAKPGGGLGGGLVGGGGGGLGLGNGTADGGPGDASARAGMKRADANGAVPDRETVSAEDLARAQRALVDGTTDPAKDLSRGAAVGALSLNRDVLDAEPIRLVVMSDNPTAANEDVTEYLRSNKIAFVNVNDPISRAGTLTLNNSVSTQNGGNKLNDVAANHDAMPERQQAPSPINNLATGNITNGTGTGNNGNGNIVSNNTNTTGTTLPSEPPMTKGEASNLANNSRGYGNNNNEDAQRGRAGGDAAGNRAYSQAPNGGNQQNGTRGGNYAANDQTKAPGGYASQSPQPATSQPQLQNGTSNNDGAVTGVTNNGGIDNNTVQQQAGQMAATSTNTYRAMLSQRQLQELNTRIARHGNQWLEEVRPVDPNYPLQTANHFDKAVAVNSAAPEAAPAAGQQAEVGAGNLTLRKYADAARPAAPAPAMDRAGGLDHHEESKAKADKTASALDSQPSSPDQSPAPTTRPMSSPVAATPAPTPAPTSEPLKSLEAQKDATAEGTARDLKKSLAVANEKTAELPEQREQMMKQSKFGAANGSYNLAPAEELHEVLIVVSDQPVNIPGAVTAPRPATQPTTQISDELRLLLQPKSIDRPVFIAPTTQPVGPESK